MVLSYKSSFGTDEEKKKHFEMKMLFDGNKIYWFFSVIPACTSFPADYFPQLKL